MFETWKITCFALIPHITIFHKDFITYQRTIMIIQNICRKGENPRKSPWWTPQCISIFGITPPRQLTNYTLTQQNHCESQKLSCLEVRTHIPSITISTHVALDNYIDWTICHLLSRRLKVFLVKKFLGTFLNKNIIKELDDDDIFYYYLVPKSDLNEESH